MTTPSKPRRLARIIESVPTADGAGVQLRRSLGRGPHARLDPFLLLDEFSSYDPNDYLAGFPAHPHRGFETVTYMLDGHMLHEDHLGNRGDLKSGDVQWMTAGRGIVHSEMPQQAEGRMRGFQLWINLPASEKMKPASYRDIPAASIPRVRLAGGATARLIAGALTDERGARVLGPMQGLSTAPLYADLELPVGAAAAIPVPDGHNCFVYVYEGEVRLGPNGSEQPLPAQAAGVLSDGNAVRIVASAATRCLLLAGQPINETVAQYGPFVMNTREELEQAVRDYQDGSLTRY